MKLSTHEYLYNLLIQRGPFTHPRLTSGVSLVVELLKTFTWLNLEFICFSPSNVQQDLCLYISRAFFSLFWASNTWKWDTHDETKQSEKDDA